MIPKDRTKSLQDSWSGSHSFDTFDPVIQVEEVRYCDSIIRSGGCRINSRDCWLVAPRSLTTPDSWTDSSMAKRKVFQLVTWLGSQSVTNTQRREIEMVSVDG